MNATFTTKRKKFFVDVEGSDPFLHVAMREFCVDEPPRAIFDADSLSHAFPVDPNPVDIEEKETIPQSYTEKCGAVNAKFRKKH